MANNGETGADTQAAFTTTQMIKKRHETRIQTNDIGQEKQQSWEKIDG